MYRECKEICKAVERGDSDVNLDMCQKDETAANTAECKVSPDMQKENYKKRDVPC